MSDFRPIETAGGVTTLAAGCEHTGKIRVVRVQDVEDILSWNETTRNSGGGYSKDGSMQHLARLPVVLVEEWLKQGINVFDKNDEKKVFQKIEEHNKLMVAGKRRFRVYLTKLLDRPARTRA